MIYDIAVLGAGHNGLICAAYLAQAGLRVAVLERRHIIGGAVCTQDDLIPGCKIDVGSSAHIMIHLTPVLRDLDLASHGLEYIEMDPWASFPIPGEKKCLLFWRDLEKTCDSIAAISPDDARSYKKFVQHYLELNRGIFETFLMPPTPGRLALTMLKRNFLHPASRKMWSSLDTARQLMAPYRSLIEELFINSHVRTALEWLAAQTGPAPIESATGDLLGWNAMLHHCGAHRAKGGSGALTRVLGKKITSHGGEIITGYEAVQATHSGRLWTITSADGRETLALRLVSAMHIVPFLTKIWSDAPESLRKKAAALRIGNGFGMIVRHLVSELPAYTGDPALDGLCHCGLQLLCPSREHLLSSYIDYLAGFPPALPSVVGMTFTALDPTLAPPGRHLLYTWGQWHPHTLSNGEHWTAIAEREADKLYALVCKYAPNMRGALLDRFIQTPDRIAEMLALPNANVMHLEMSLDQMFFFRPLPELCAYKVPGAKNLYLTGASTHPGGGVFGASGHNTAQLILSELGLAAR
jgi:phytoene dehydrogenase-like protein